MDIIQYNTIQCHSNQAQLACFAVFAVRLHAFLAGVAVYVCAAILESSDDR